MKPMQPFFEKLKQFIKKIKKKLGEKVYKAEKIIRNLNTSFDKSIIMNLSSTLVYFLAFSFESL